VTLGVIRREFSFNQLSIVTTIIQNNLISITKK